MAYSPEKAVSPDEYLAMEQASPVGHEFFSGAVIAMASNTEAHNLVVGNLIGEIHNFLKGIKCKVFPSDFRVAAFLILLLTSTAGYGQTYVVESLDGRQEEIRVWPLSQTLKVACNGDTLCAFNNYIEEVQVSLLNKNFAAVSYEVHDVYKGPDFRWKYLLIICVKDGKVYAPLHIRSGQIYREHGAEPLSDYRVDASIAGRRKKMNFRLKLSVFGLYWSDTSEVSTGARRKNVRLKYHKQGKVFFNDYIRFDTQHIYYDRHDATSYDEKAPVAITRGHVPVARIRDMEYYFYDDRWFELAWKPYIYCTTAKCSR